MPKVQEKKPKPLHERLHALLQQKWRSGEFTQESLAKAVGKEQTTVGSYLRGDKAGPLDLDEADAALRHIRSSLKDFISDPAYAPAPPPPPQMSPVVVKIVNTLSTVDDDRSLRSVLAIAKSVGAAFRRSKRRSIRQPARDRAATTASVARRRRGRKQTDPKTTKAM